MLFFSPDNANSFSSSSSKAVIPSSIPSRPHGHHNSSLYSGHVMKGIDCSRGTNISSRFATEQAGEYHRPEPMSISPLYSVGVAEYVLPKSRVH